jgi:O-6-methylguanine DNA methyltransferase
MLPPMTSPAAKDTLRATLLSTSWGWVAMVRSGTGLRGLTLPEPTRERAFRFAREHWPDAVWSDGAADGAPGDPAGKAIARQIHDYFEGKRIRFDVPLDLGGLAPFHRKVLLRCFAIPYGETRTYGALAKEAGSPGAFRAVGHAMATNPIAIVIPCHRVVGSDGSLRGFGGGLPMKERLLRMEGARTALF